MKVYLASPLGFNPEHLAYRHRIADKLRQLGCTIFDPWEQQGFERELVNARALSGYSEQIKAFRSIAAGLGRANEEGIVSSDALFAVLDGLEVDSGTAAEIGFASALGKPCYGLRSDWRDSGDFPGLPCNLQVLHFIERSKGILFRSIDDITQLNGNTA